MSNAGLVLKLLQVNASGPFNRWAGIEIVSAEPGCVELRMAWKEEAAQDAGFLHAGLVGALIDTACRFAAFTQVGSALTSHYSVNCIAPAAGRAFHCMGAVVKADKRQVFARAELFAETEDGERTLVATGETILFVA